MAEVFQGCGGGDSVWLNKAGYPRGGHFGQGAAGRWWIVENNKSGLEMVADSAVGWCNSRSIGACDNRCYRVVAQEVTASAAVQNHFDYHAKEGALEGGVI
ncbi:MAG: hypothetical protein GXX96_01880 [Planctomycetaceae bacterium]|nr:hypothetical protein [Planctomycetaceae bacterium]